MDETIICTTTDSIEVLNLSVRVHNALKRAKYWDIGEVIVLSDDQLFAVRNLGEKGVAEIRERLSRVELLDAPPSTHENEPQKEWSGEPRILIDLGPPTIPRHEVIKWQQQLLVKQINAGLLHPRVLVDGDTLGDLAYTRHINDQELYIRLLKILMSSVSVSDEMEKLLDPLDSRELDILRRRNGFKQQTLAQIAESLSLSRERIRQIEQKVQRNLASSVVANSLIRMRSAILHADDEDLSFKEWSRRLQRTGLLGDWSQVRFASIDQLELLVVVTKLLRDTSLDFEIPESFNNLMTLRNNSLPDSPARAHGLLESFGGATERLVLRHLRYSGAVSLDWLVNQESVEISKGDLSLILKSRDFFSVDENWYMSDRYVPDRLVKDSVFHRSLLKMFQVCGPLEISDVYFGLEHTLIKTDFPRPPIGVLSKVLLRYGYDCEERLWYWGGDSNEELNSGERIIMRTLTENSGVAHHSQLAIAFINSSNSFALLHATLRRSPLFENFERSIYKLRGSIPTLASIQQARESGVDTPIDLEFHFDLDGNIVLHANLGTLAVGHGTITSARLPNLAGNWGLAGTESDSAQVEVTENEIRGLRPVLQMLGCAVGDRIKMTFDTDTHEISVTRIE